MAKINGFMNLFVYIPEKNSFVNAGLYPPFIQQKIIFLCSGFKAYNKCHFIFLKILKIYILMKILKMKPILDASKKNENYKIMFHFDQIFFVY